MLGVDLPLPRKTWTCPAKRLTEPQFYLPPHLRTNVEPIVDLIEKVEAIEYQGRKG